MINTGRTPTAAYLVLHRAGCGTINGRPARGTTFTGEYIKVCGDLEELEGFASQPGGQAQHCGLCLAQPGQPRRQVPAGGKYGPLRDHLESCTGARVRMTFTEMEKLVGRLPDSAHRHRAWWGNNGSNVEAQAWLDAGWRVESVNQASGEVVFARSVTAPARSSRRPVTDRLAPYIDPQVSASVADRAGALGLDSGKLVRLITELNDNYSRGKCICRARAAARGP